MAHHAANRPARLPGRALRRAAALLPLALALAASARAAADDPLVGKWLGTCGTARERVEVGLEFRPARRALRCSCSPSRS